MLHILGGTPVGNFAMFCNSTCDSRVHQGSAPIHDMTSASQAPMKCESDKPLSASAAGLERPGRIDFLKSLVEKWRRDGPRRL